MAARRWSRRLLVVLLGGALLLPSVPAAADGAPHWAAPSAGALSERLGWTAPAELDAPIPILEWNRLVALLLDEAPGGGDPQASPHPYWIWTYTAGMTGGRMVLSREEAIGGLMKLTNYLFAEKEFTGDQSLLQPFADGPAVADFQQVLVAGALRLGLVRGYPGAELHPASPLTYAEAATLLARLAERYHLSPSRRYASSSRPEPRGFGAGLGLKIPREQIIHAGWPVGSAGTAWWVVNGAAYTADLAGAGPAPEGSLWVVADVEVYNWEFPELRIPAGALEFTLESGTGTVATYVPDPAASAALGSPFGKEEEILRQGESLRGLLVYPVRAGTTGIHMRMRSKLGLAPGKPGWNSEGVTPIGRIPSQGAK